MGGARQGRREPAYQSDMEATEDAASRRSSATRRLSVYFAKASYGVEVCSRKLPAPATRLTRTLSVRWPQTVVEIEAPEPPVARRVPELERIDTVNRAPRGARMIVRNVPSSGVETV